MNTRFANRSRSAFTLIELLTVITIIAVLMGLLFPVIGGVQQQMKKTQAKNDLSQVNIAMSAYQTEYGRFPAVGTDGKLASVTGNADLIYTLRAKDSGANADHKLNPRQIRFFQPSEAKVVGTLTVGGVSPTDGALYDPWGSAYQFYFDADYDGEIDNPYSSNAGSSPLEKDFIGLSLGKDGEGGSGDAKAGTGADDVQSW